MTLFERGLRRCPHAAELRDIYRLFRYCDPSTDEAEVLEREREELVAECDATCGVAL